MSDSESAYVMLAKAIGDFKAISGMIDSSVFTDEVFGFHAQQAVEKALKSWIAFLGIKFPYTHDIALLLTILEDNGNDVNEFWGLVDLNIYAVQFRYLFGESPDKPLDRPATINDIKTIVNLVKCLIEKK